jgi:hypothetical protein
MLGDAANQVKASLERIAVGVSVFRGDEDLRNVGFGRKGDLSAVVLIEGDVAPAENFHSAFFGRGFQQLAAGFEGVACGRQKGHADAVLAFVRQPYAGGRAFCGEQFVRNVKDQARAVAGFGVATAGAAVFQALERFDPTRDDIVRSGAVDLGDKADAARVVLGLGVVHRDVVVRSSTHRWHRRSPSGPQTAGQPLGGR